MKSIINWCTGSYRGWLVNNKKTRLLKLYEAGKYLDIPNLFKGEKDYKEITYDDFPFLYFMISQSNKQAVQAYIKNITFKEYLMFDESNPLKCNPLMFSYLENKTDVAEIFEKEGFSLGIANSEGQNILHVAAIYRRKQAFFEGLKKKANHELADMYGNTPLHYTCRAGEIEMIEALLAGKAAKTPNRIHLYPIHMAIQSTKPEAVELLKNDLWGKYPHFHPIHSAVRVGAVQIMRTMLKSEPTLLNQFDEKRLTPLHHAVLTDCLESVDFLLRQNGILVNIADQHGNTPLHLAFMRDDLCINEITQRDGKATDRCKGRPRCAERRSPVSSRLRFGLQQSRDGQIAEESGQQEQETVGMEDEDVMYLETWKSLSRYQFFSNCSQRSILFQFLC